MRGRLGLLARRAFSTATPKKESIAALAQRRNLRGEVCLVRADLNVPLSKGSGPPEITDATRLLEALPTIRLLVSEGAKVVCCSHLGRPKKAKDAAELSRMSLAPIAARMSSELGFEVAAVDDCVGASVTATVSRLREGGVALLENTRFHKEEEKNDSTFSASLVSSCGVRHHHLKYGPCRLLDCLWSSMLSRGLGNHFRQRCLWCSASIACVNGGCGAVRGACSSGTSAPERARLPLRCRCRRRKALRRHPRRRVGEDPTP